MCRPFVIYKRRRAQPEQFRLINHTLDNEKDPGHPSCIHSGSMSGVKQHNNPEIEPGESNSLPQETSRINLPDDPTAWNHWVGAVPGSESDQTIDFPKLGRDKSLTDIRSNPQIPQALTLVASGASSQIDPTPAHGNPQQQHRSPSSVSTPLLILPDLNQRERTTRRSLMPILLTFLYF